MKSKVLIRADGSAKIGLGHLVRCLALGHMLKHDFEVHFACKEVPDSIRRDIEQAGFFFKAVDHENEFLEVLTGEEIVVLDHYGLDSKYQKKIKEIGCKLVCIDDLHEKEFYADLIINHAPGINHEDYTTQAYTQLAIGPEFALLRPAFLNGAKKEKRSKETGTVLLCFGGSDIKNLTLQTLKIVLNFDEVKKTVVITGGAYKYQEQLALFGKALQNVLFFHEVGADKMAELISDSDITIVPSSGILMEALAVGNKVISGMYVENQRYLFENFKRLNVFFSAEDFTPINFKTALKKCLSAKTNGDRIIDGYSDQRILKTFKQLILEQEIQLRKAKVTDSSLTYKWAIDKAIRAFSFNQNEIRWEDHSQWFLSKIKDKRCYYFIAEWNHHFIGSIRFDIEGDEAVVSYLIDSDFHHRGLGVPLLQKGLETLLLEKNKNLKKIIGFVMPENIASCKVFERFGFSKVKDKENYKYTVLIK